MNTQEIKQLQEEIKILKSENKKLYDYLESKRDEENRYWKKVNKQYK